jgi:hypothetical protein
MQPENRIPFFLSCVETIFETKISGKILESPPAFQVYSLPTPPVRAVSWELRGCANEWAKHNINNAIAPG